jgi:DHA1 family tetracycline resistance protein-like MFS transporter
MSYKTVICNSARVISSSTYGTQDALSSRRMQVRAEVPKVAAQLTLKDGRKKVLSKRSFLAIFLPWLYFMATSMQIATLPKYINSVVNSGNVLVSPASARTYGHLQGLDSFFTFLSVNAIGLLSDHWGRKPFMIYSSAGLAIAYTLIIRAKSIHTMYLAAAIDGCSSCMLSQAQAYVADCTERNDLSVELGKFQGLAVGMAFFCGVPLGSVLASTVSPQAPLIVAIVFCVVNMLAISLFLPESLDRAEVRKTIPWGHANPLGTFQMFGRSRKFAFSALSYFFLQLSQSGMQVTWINYLQHRFGWTGGESGMTLMIGEILQLH